MTRRARYLAMVPALALVAGLVNCSGIDADAPVVATCPPADSANFKNVSSVLERRCGTLDCHGSTYRPLRIYGQYALRRPEAPDSTNLAPGQYASYYPGGIPTTTKEMEDNGRSICGLEPEKTAMVLAHEAEPDTLTIVRKARLQEKHKGGIIWAEGEYGDQCLLNWLNGPKENATVVDQAPCVKELENTN